MQTRLISYLVDGRERAGVAMDGRVVGAAELSGNPSYGTVQGILDDWGAARDWLANLNGPAAGSVDISEVRLLAPLPKPSIVYCAGANYRDHLENMSRIQNLPMDPDPHTLGLNPWHFMKAGHCVVGTGARVFSTSTALDWEAELAVVIGLRARNVGQDEALDYVAGYCAANDLSARERGKRDKIDPLSPFKYDWIAHKNFDGSCPLGPWLVPAFDVPDPQALAIKLWVNDTIRQDSNTDNMIFTIAEQIAHLSSIVTLHPGDVILTGTPAGVGAETGERLYSGDVVRITIDGLGDLITTIG